MSTAKTAINDVHNSNLYLYFYSEALTEERTNLECDFITKQCVLDGSEKILDLACGHGRHSIAFAKQGYSVLGIDMNTQFIEIAKTNAKEHGLDLNFEEGDILQYPIKNEFDTVILLYNTLGFFDREDVTQLFSQISRSLAKGGKVFLDCKNRDHIIKEIKPYAVHEKGEDLMIDRISFDPVKGTTTNLRTYIKDGKRYEAPFTMYCYNYTDLERFVTKAGMRITKVIGGWKGEEFNSESRRIILILEK